MVYALKFRVIVSDRVQGLGLILLELGVGCCLVLGPARSRRLYFWRGGKTVRHSRVVPAEMSVSLSA